LPSKKYPDHAIVISEPLCVQGDRPVRDARAAVETDVQLSCRAAPSARYNVRVGFASLEGAERAMRREIDNPSFKHAKNLPVLLGNACATQ
jgi:hypothetical protein